MGQRLESTTNQVPVDRDTDGLRNDETESRRKTSVPTIQIDESVTGRQAPTTPHESTIVVGPDKPVGSCQHETELRGKFGASLAATRAEDGAAGTGAHAQTESVHLGAAPVVRLEGSLAHGLGLSHIGTPQASS